MKRPRGESASAKGKIDSYFRPQTRSGATRQEAIIKASQNDDIKNLLKGEETGTVEENILGLLDTQGIKDTGDIEDDKLAFLEAVHEVFIASNNARSPSGRIYKAVFSCLQDSKSVELAMSSYRLLLDLEKAWSPLKSSANFEVQASSLYGHPVDITTILPRLSADVQRQESPENILISVLTLHLLVELWKRDFKIRKDKPELSFVNQQLKRLTFKQFDEFLKAVIHLSTVPFGSSSDLEKVLRRNYIVQSAQSIMSMAIELDNERNTIETMMELLHSDQLASFLQSMKDPRQKLDVVMRSLLRHLPKNAKKRLDEDETSAASFKKMLDSLSDDNIARQVTKSVIQLLVAHGFQALLIIQDKDEVAGFCSSFKSAFHKLFPNLKDSMLHQDLMQAFVVAEALG